MGELWGITADGWVAIATLIGAGAVVLSGLALLGGVLLGFRHGVKQVIRQRQSDDVRKAYIDGGIAEVWRNVSDLFQRSKLNHLLALRLLKHVEDYDGTPVRRLVPEEIPSMLADFPVLNSKAVTPTLLLVRTHPRSVLYDLLNSVFEIAFAVNSDLEFGLRHRLINFYQNERIREGSRFPRLASILNCRNRHSPQSDVQEWVEGERSAAIRRYKIIETIEGVADELLVGLHFAQADNLETLQDALHLFETQEMKQVAARLERVDKTFRDELQLHPDLVT